MKYFKVKASRLEPRYEINKENFSEVTKHSFPFEQKDDITGKAAQYAICPSCFNSIQLIGVVKDIKVSPYGKHTGKSIDGFPAWNEVNYEYCPYAIKNKRKNFDDTELLNDMTPALIEVYDLLMSQFDRVVYVVEKLLDIRCSNKFWKSTLNSYIVNHIYLSPFLTEVNLPLMFVIGGMQQSNVYGQCFLEDSNIFETLSKYKGVKLVPTKDKRYFRLENSNSFLDLHFKCNSFRPHAEQGEILSESIVFCIDDYRHKTDGMATTIYKKKIYLDENYFMRVVNKKVNKDKRRQDLLDIAKEVMLPYPWENKGKKPT